MAGDDGAVRDDGAAGEEVGESRSANRSAEPLVAPTVKSSLLWGLVGGLSFLVLVQGYELVADPPIGFGAKFAVAVLVTVGAAAVAHLTRDKLPTETESP